MTKGEDLDLKINSSVTVPRVPNYLKVNGEYKPLYTLTPDQLRVVGSAWTNALIDRATEQSQDSDFWDRQKENEG